MPTEVWDVIERELKFDRNGSLLSDEDLLDVIRPYMDPSWRLISLGPVPTLDIYFDTAAFSLFRQGASLRLRTRRKSGWSANFKPDSVDETLHMERRELKTKLKRKEIGNGLTGDMPGLAFAMGEASVRDFEGASAELAPNVLISTVRRLYTVRPPDSPELEGRWADLTGPGLVYFTIDDVVGMDMRGEDIMPIIRSKALDFTHRRPATDFKILELEASGRFRGMEAEAFSLMNLLGEAVARDTGMSVLKRSKYQQAVENLFARSTLHL